MRPRNFEGQVAVVTGAGRGIGRNEALQLARRGASVVVNDIGGPSTDRSPDRVVAEIEAEGGRAIASHESVATPEGGAAIVDLAVSKYGRIDVLVNNAGNIRPDFIEDLSVERLDDVLDVHLRGAFFCTQPAWRVMQKQAYGRIVNTASASGLLSHQMIANYAAAKAGIYGLTKALAFEGQDHGIKVNCILPVARGAMRTGDPGPAMDMYAETMRRNQDRFKRVELPADTIEPRRDPGLVAALVTYLTSPECSVTGEAYSICLGRFARVFVGLADGWLAEDPSTVSADVVAEHMDEIRDLDNFSVPSWLFDESADILDRIARL